MQFGGAFGRLFGDIVSLVYFNTSACISASCLLRYLRTVTIWLERFVNYGARAPLLPLCARFPSPPSTVFRNPTLALSIACIRITAVLRLSERRSSKQPCHSYYAFKPTNPLRNTHLRDQVIPSVINRECLIPTARCFVQSSTYGTYLYCYVSCYVPKYRYNPHW